MHKGGACVTAPAIRIWIQFNKPPRLVSFSSSNYPHPHQHPLTPPRHRATWPCSTSGARSSRSFQARYVLASDPSHHSRVDQSRSRSHRATTRRVPLYRAISPIGWYGARRIHVAPRWNQQQYHRRLADPSQATRGALQNVLTVEWSGHKTVLVEVPSGPSRSNEVELSPLRDDSRSGAGNNGYGRLDDEDSDVRGDGNWRGGGSVLISRNRTRTPAQATLTSLARVASASRPSPNHAATALLLPSLLVRRVHSHSSTVPNWVPTRSTRTARTPGPTSSPNPSLPRRIAVVYPHLSLDPTLISTINITTTTTIIIIDGFTTPHRSPIDRNNPRAPGPPPPHLPRDGRHSNPRLPRTERSPPRRPTPPTPPTLEEQEASTTRGAKAVGARPPLLRAPQGPGIRGR